MARQWAVFVILLVKIILGSCEEASDDTPKEDLGNEYEQIFHSIPTLFEYILEILEEKPEILEKNDVTLFQETCNSGVERQIGKCENLNIDEHKRNTFKRNIVFNYFANSINARAAVGASKTTTKIPEIVTGNDHDLAGGPNEIPPELLKQTRDEQVSTGLPGSDNDFQVTTGIPDVSNVIKQIKNNRIDKSVVNSKDSSSFITTEVPEPDQNIVRRLKPQGGANGLNKVISRTKAKLNDQIKKSRMDQKHKRNVNLDSFVGSIDWSKFYLSPEQVEEQALKTELAIEDHNKKKG